MTETMDVSALSDADLTRAVAEAVMGWKQASFKGYWKDQDGQNRDFHPLTDANDRDRVVERMREVWNQYFKDTGKARGWVIRDVAGFWRVEIWDSLEIVHHILNPSQGRAICEAAVADRMKK